MGTKITISSVHIRDVRPYGWNEKKGPGAGKTHGHEFEFAVTLGFDKFLSTGKTRYFKASDEESVIEWADKGTWGNPPAWGNTAGMPVLVWGERIRWYEVSGTGIWTFVAEDSVDMFEIAPTAKTFGGIYDIGMMGAGWSNPWNYAANNGLVLATAKPKGFNDAANEATRAALTAKWFRDKKMPLELVTIDRPGLTKSPSGSGAGGGGGLTVHVQKPSRVRAIHFTLGFQGTGLQARATQILETQSGVPTICKFIKVGIDDSALENTANHARWRRQINTANYRADENWNFDL